MRLPLPWYVRIGAKIVLSRLPIPYRAWRRLSLFRHGDMDNADYAWNSFRRHFDRCAALGLRAPFSAIEFGPGDSLASAVIARSHGATMVCMLDSGDYATTDTKLYEALSRRLVRQGISTNDAASYESRAEYLSANSASYMTGGLGSLRTIPADAFDFAWSEAVLEHVRLYEFDEFIREMRRVLRLGGLASHRVDLQDHLGGSLNNLRFSESVWESRLMSSSGFYTNRIRATDMLNRFRRHGFNVEMVSMDRWDRVPIARGALAEPFGQLADLELTVNGFDVVLRAV